MSKTHSLDFSQVNDYMSAADIHVMQRSVIEDSTDVLTGFGAYTDQTLLFFSFLVVLCERKDHRSTGNRSIHLVDDSIRFNDR